MKNWTQLDKIEGRSLLSIESIPFSFALLATVERKETAVDQIRNENEKTRRGFVEGEGRELEEVSGS